MNPSRRNFLIGRPGRSSPATGQAGGVARIAPACLAWQDVICRACGDACDVRAIRFRPQLGGAARPEIDTALCTGCGACVEACPARAVSVPAT